MPVQIDHLETSVDITPPAGAAAQRSERSMPPSGETSVPPALKDAVLKVLAEEFESFSRMRGH
jgi:hypothetical protein